ncbi:MAG: prepilin-type N-terminal cleavage/methylation domain-containing protein [Acidimicrobiia bacterium]|nr:prepilin-type N-terminal cleavage/methylation domain-containing protein [Acidimicrobiia bacterium]
MRQRMRQDDGFSLMESVMAMVVVVILFVAIATSLQVSMNHQKKVRLQQQGTALMMQELEVARDTDWIELENATAPPASDYMLTGSKINGAFFGLPTDEKVEVGSGDVVPFEAAYETYDGVDFDVHRLISVAGDDLRRVVIVVEWDFRGETQHFYGTTLVTEFGASS